MKKKELEDLEKDELIKECENRGRLIKIILKEIKELEDRSQYNLHYNSILLSPAIKKIRNLNIELKDKLKKLESEGK